MSQSRREFLQFMGQSTAALGIASTLPSLISCATTKPQYPPPFLPLAATTEDAFKLASGFEHQVLISWGDRLNKKGEVFGFNCDYTAFIPFTGKTDEGILWVNHEFPCPVFVSNYKGKGKKTLAQIQNEQDCVGGSLVHIRQLPDTRWEVVKDSNYNRRLTGRTPIPLVSDRLVDGSSTAYGTMGNCAGGVTPWGSILSCEENFQDYYGDFIFHKGRWKVERKDVEYAWHLEKHRSPAHYGWVVEVNPLTGEAKKLTSLGRFGHETATVVVAKDGRCVVYSGDDAPDKCLYKFVAAQVGSLDKGELFVADLNKKRWVSLDIRKQPLLRQHFKDQTEVQIYARQAAVFVGGTPLDRPEGVVYSPITKTVYVSLTNNLKKGNNFGSILKLQEKNNDPLSMEFEHGSFLLGGEQTGWACPDNLALDRKSNLWMTTDMSFKKGNYKDFANNSLFYIPLTGDNAGESFRVASGPIESELTGPSFNPDGSSMFLSVQHPGEETKDIKNPTSNWPDGKGLPRPSVVVITGPKMKELNS